MTRRRSRARASHPRECPVVDLLRRDDHSVMAPWWRGVEVVEVAWPWWSPGLGLMVGVVSTAGTPMEGLWPLTDVRPVNKAARELLAALREEAGHG